MLGDDATRVTTMNISTLPLLSPQAALSLKVEAETTLSCPHLYTGYQKCKFSSYKFYLTLNSSFVRGGIVGCVFVLVYFWCFICFMHKPKGKAKREVLNRFFIHEKEN